MNTIQDHRNDEEINISDLIFFLWSRKYHILIIVAVISFISVAASYLVPNYYKSYAIVEVVSSSMQTSPSNSSVGALASIAGINLSGGGANKKAFVIETLKSRDFVKNLIQNENILASIFAPKSYIPSTGELVLDEEIYSFKEQKWTRKVSYPYSTRPSILEAHKKINDDILSINEDKKTGYITIAIEHISPIFARDFLVLVIDELNKVTREKDLTDSQEAINYLKQEASRSSLSALNNSIAALLESKLETQMMARIHKDYLLRYIDPPFIPEKKSWPMRSSILILAFMGSLLFVVFIYIMQFFNIRKEV